MLPHPWFSALLNPFHNLSLIQIDFLLFCGGMGKRELFFFFQFGLKCASPQIYQLQLITAPNFLYKWVLGMAVCLGGLIALLLWHFL